MVRKCGLKFNLIKLSFFKLKKTFLENFWRIFQVLIFDLVRRIKVVNFHKKPIWALRPNFFLIFSSDSNSSAHITLSLNWILKNKPKIKKNWINRPNLEIRTTVDFDKRIIVLLSHHRLISIKTTFSQCGTKDFSIKRKIWY